MTEVKLSLYNNFFSVVIIETNSQPLKIYFGKEEKIFKVIDLFLGTKTFFSSLFSCHFFLASKSKWHERRMTNMMTPSSSSSCQKLFSLFHLRLKIEVGRPHTFYCLKWSSSSLPSFPSRFLLFDPSSFLTVKNRHEANKNLHFHEHKVWVGKSTVLWISWIDKTRNNIKTFPNLMANVWQPRDHQEGCHSRQEQLLLNQGEDNWLLMMLYVMSFYLLFSSYCQKSCLSVHYKSHNR